MELKTEKRKIGEYDFYINQFPARKAIRLEKRTLTYIAPMLKMLDGIKSLDDEINFNGIVSAIQEVLMNLDEETLEQFIFDMISYTSVGLRDKNNKEQIMKLDGENGTIFDNVFRCNNLSMYKLILEIMKVNKFAFFEFMGGGGEKIGIFSKMMPKAEIS